MPDPVDGNGRNIPATFALEIGRAITEGDVVDVLGRWLPDLDPADRDLAEALAAQQMEWRRRVDEAGQLALVDPLTGAANRRGFAGHGDDHLGQWRLDSEPFALGVLDIDRFKDVNDRFGHNVGDEVLKLIVDTLTNQSRAGDVIARIGGEEFAILIAHATRTEAMAVFERIRRTVAGLEVSVGDQVVSVTASIGVTTAGPDDTDVDDVFVRADAALYEAKAAGRNNVVFRGPDPD